ncbi:hypothetical protein Tco_0059695 [Tanacetum coccineum]
MSLTGQRSPWLSVMLQGEIDSDLVMWFCSPSLLSLKPPMGSATRVYAYVGFCFCRYYTNKKSDAKIDVLELDLIPLASARAFAANYLSLDLPLHMLIYRRQVVHTIVKRFCQQESWEHLQLSVALYINSDVRVPYSFEKTQGKPMSGLV